MIGDCYVLLMFLRRSVDETWDIFKAIDMSCKLYNTLEKKELVCNVLVAVNRRK